ncbi:MAG: hypothetical protein Q8O94_03120 [bacterium]|nr:hypothetical protein [bacterium]
MNIRSAPCASTAAAISAARSRRIPDEQTGQVQTEPQCWTPPIVAVESPRSRSIGASDTGHRPQPATRP